ncbi:MAG: hypothetical protein WCG85_17925, partial [Polyangia bacterium]
MVMRVLMRMFVGVDMLVFMRVRHPIMGVLMGMSVKVLMLVAMLVLAFHRSSSFSPRWRKAI